MEISELVLYTSDIQSIKNFYSETIGFKIINDKIDEVSFRTGSTVLIFKSAEGINPFYHYAFNIPSNKIEEARQYFESKVSFLKETDGNIIVDFKNWHAKSIYFLDPAGNIVEFISRFDLNENSDEPFSISQTLSVSEIGIVTENVPSLKNILIEKYDVKDFTKSVNSETFSAMGDDNGLFIVAVDNRNWYPTQIASQIFPFSVKFINNSGNEFVLTDKDM